MVALCYHVYMRQNEKKTPHYNLERIKDLINKNHYLVTKTATENAVNDFNIKPTDIPKFIMQITNQDFYKSMTSEQDNKIWQDVYHFKVQQDGTAYIKLQIIENDTSVIIQFKRK